MLEICATNIQSALAAQAAGAGRIELCAALDSGGLTPSAGLINIVRSYVEIPVNVLLRPREGNFCYTDAEFEIIINDIVNCHIAGVEGVVIGALDPDGQLDIPALKALIKMTAGLDLTFHRAFDFTPDPFEALEILIDLGFSRILSSGQSASAYEGRFLLQKLVEKADGRISIMPGAGINAGNIQEIAQTTGAKEFHLSGRVKVNPERTEREIPGLDTGYWESDPALIREVVALSQSLI